MRKSIILLVLVVLFCFSIGIHQGGAEEWAWDVRAIIKNTTRVFSTKAIGADTCFVAYGSTFGARILRTQDRGESWKDLPIAATLGGSGVNGISIDAVDMNNLFVIFSDNGNLRFAKSTNGGATWSTQVLDAAASSSTLPDIKIALPHVYVIYSDAPNANVKFLPSIDSGATWGAPVVVEAMPANTVPMLKLELLPKYNNPTLGNDIKAAYVTRNTVTGTTALRYVTSNNQGIVWGAPATILAGLDAFSAISFDGGIVGSTFPLDEFISYSFVNGPDFGTFIYFTNDGGTSWSWANIVPLSPSGQTTSLSYFEQNGLSFVALTFTGNDKKFRFAKSNDRGVTWTIGTIDGNSTSGLGMGCSLSTVSGDIGYIAYAEGSASAYGKIARLIPFSSMPSTVQSITGLGVLKAPEEWSMVKDAATGDQLERGLIAAGLYAFDGSYWNRVRGSNLGLTATIVASPVGLLTLLDSVTGVGAGGIITISSGVVSRMTWQIEIAGGTLTTLVVNLEGSIDGGTHWFLLDYSTQVTDQMRHVVNKFITSIRGNITGWVVGIGAPTLTLKFVGLMN